MAKRAPAKKPQADPPGPDGPVGTLAEPRGALDLYGEMSIADLKAAKWDRNPRVIDPAEFEALKRSLSTFGTVEPVIFNRQTGRVVGGHQRIDAMEALGIATTVVRYVDLDEQAEAALNVALNRISGEWKWDEITRLIASMDDSTRALTGFVQDEVDALLRDGHLLQHQVDQARSDLREFVRSQAPPSIETEDVPPDPPRVAISRRGDTWLLGGNRLRCGDSTVEADVLALMGDERAGLMNTDPPYGISFDNAALGPTRREYAAIANDELTDQNLQAFLERVFTTATQRALLPNAAWYLWHAHLTQGYFAAAAAAAAAAANVKLHRQIIWVKPRLILGRGQYHWRHEPCFMGWCDGQQPPDYGRGAGERDQTTVWELDGVPVDDRREFGHATPKPVSLFEIPIVKHLRQGELCYEPFAGSGPQILAAERNGRRCFAMELDPRFVDVGVRRWEKLTGGRATLEGDGRTIDEIGADRGVLE